MNNFKDDEVKDPLQFAKQYLQNFQSLVVNYEEMSSRLEQAELRIKELEQETERLLSEQQKNNLWSSRVTYENVVDQIASLEDTSKRDDARRMIEPLLKKGQVTEFRRDIKRRVKELNEDSDAFSDEQVAQALESCVGKGQVIDAKWKWAGAYWYLRWTCNYPVDAKEFCQKIKSLELDIPADYECSYESIRKICTLSFMDYDARRMDIVRVSKNDQGVFSQCREVALKLAEELGKASLPQE